MPHVARFICASAEHPRGLTFVTAHELGRHIRETRGMPEPPGLLGRCVNGDHTYEPHAGGCQCACHQWGAPPQ